MRLFLRTETRSVLWPPTEERDCVACELTPRGPLRGYVDRIRIGRDHFASPVVEHVLPDGAVHLFFELGKSMTAVVMGATTSPTEIRLAGRLEQVGVQLRPGGLSALIGVPASELNGRIVPLQDLWGAHACDVLERLATAPLEARADVIAEVLVERLAASAAADRRAAEGVRRIVGSHGKTTIRDLADGLGVGERRLEQIFRREVGLSPKALCRVTRFRAAVDHVFESPSCSWAEVAHACGFYDQAHLVNEFRAMAGVAPGTLADFGFVQYGSRAAD